MIPNPMRLTRIVRKMMSSGRVTTVANILQSRASHERHLRRCARRGGRAGRVGSVTKMFTTAALVMLAEEGRLKLADPISSVAGGLNGRIGRLTTHQLM